MVCDEYNTMVPEEITRTLDVKGENCPMPVVKTKQTIDDLDQDAVLEVQATDPGSMSDIAGWAETTDGVVLLDQHEDDDVFSHYVRKTE
jgi:tRNA 2-thiouridine synthesizing protein A